MYLAPGIKCLFSVRCISIWPIGSNRTLSRSFRTFSWNCMKIAWNMSNVRCFSPEWRRAWKFGWRVLSPRWSTRATRVAGCGHWRNLLYVLKWTRKTNMFFQGNQTMLGDFEVGFFAYLFEVVWTIPFSMKCTWRAFHLRFFRCNLVDVGFPLGWLCHNGWHGILPSA